MGTEYGVWSASISIRRHPSGRLRTTVFKRSVFMVAMTSAVHGATPLQRIGLRGRGFVRSTSPMQMNTLGATDNGASAD